VGLEANVSGNEENKQVESKQKEISILGIKLSYSKAFGIVFLILFLLLFFPGIGISSSSVNSTNKKTADGLGDSQGN
jgi:hypothetical protein